MSTTERGMCDMTLEEMEVDLGEHMKRYRINTMDLDQATLAARAGISVRTLRNLELGNGTTLRTFIQVLCAMERYIWLLEIVPETASRPIIVRKPKQRQRVHKPRSGRLSSEDTTD